MIFIKKLCQKYNFSIYLSDDHSSPASSLIAVGARPCERISMLLNLGKHPRKWHKRSQGQAPTGPFYSYLSFSGNQVCL